MAESSTVAIKQKWLLWVYAVVPFSFLLVAADIFLFDRALQPHLTTELLFLPLYLLLFELPHIIASFFSFADREYIAYYKKHLLYRLPVVLLCIAAIFFYSLEAGFILYAFYTMYHVVRQQTGIAITMTRRKDVWHDAWSYLGIISVFVGYVAVFSDYLVSVGYMISLVLLAVVALFILLSGYLSWRSPGTLATWYVLGVSLSIIGSYGFLLLDYLFLSVFIIRFTHDVTAFIFYITHDINRNQLTTHNYIYKVVKEIGLPLLVTVPFLAVIVAYMLRSELEVLEIGTVLLMMIGFIHYYLEGVMWKRESLHRQHIQFQ